MALTTSTITGRVPLPDDASPKAAEVIFSLSGYDTEGNQVIPGGARARFVLEADGSLPLGAKLWRNTEGLRGTSYRVTVRWSEPDRHSGAMARENDLGWVQVGDETSYTLPDLLANPAAPAPGWYETVPREVWEDILGLEDRVEANELAISDETAARIAGDIASRDRANHTGTQPISTVSGLQAALDGKATAVQGSKADTAVQPAALDAEAAARIAGDSSLQQQIDGLSAASVDGLAGPFASVEDGEAGTAPGEQFIVADPSLGRVDLYENVAGTGTYRMEWSQVRVLPTRQALADAVSAGLTHIDGTVLIAGGLLYMAQTGATAIPDMPGWVPCYGPAMGPDAGHYGFVGDGSSADTARVNAALDWVGSLGGGTVFIRTPGVYLVTNTNPYPAADYPGLSEDAANWWANRRAFWIRHDNVSLELGAGVVLKLAPNANCHVVQIGQFSLGMGAYPDIPQIGTTNSRVFGHGWVIDLDKANQKPAAGTIDHAGGVMFCHPARRGQVIGGSVINSPYYGVAFEGTNGDAERGFYECYVADMRIEDCEADGFDAKDFGTLSRGNVGQRIFVKNCGSGGDAFLSPQSAIDARGGWSFEDCNVVYSDGYTGSRVAFRGQYAPDFAQSQFPTIFRNCHAIGNGRNPGTIAYRLSGAGVECDDCSFEGFQEGFRFSAPRTRVARARGYDCDIAARWFSDAGAGWDADTSLLTEFDFTDCQTAWHIDTGVSNARIESGAISTISLTPLVDNGTNPTFSK